MDSIREPGHGPSAVNRRNISHLRDQRDRAGLLQLADILAAQTFTDAATLADEARAAVDWIDETTPRTYELGDNAGIRPGDLLRYQHDGRTRESVVIAIDGHTATRPRGHAATATPSPSEPSTGSPSIPRRPSAVGGARLLLPVEPPTGVNASPAMVAKDSHERPADSPGEEYLHRLEGRPPTPAGAPRTPRANRALQPRPARSTGGRSSHTRAQLGRSSKRQPDPPFTPSFRGSSPYRAQWGAVI